MEKFDFYSLSFIGRRNENQDSFLVYKPSEESLFLGVADGMGGVNGGKIASEIVIETCKKVLNDYFKREIQPIQLKEILISIFSNCQKEINAAAKINNELNGMGSTLSCVLILKDKYVFGNLGDSRIYLLRGNYLRQLTVDHTYLNESKLKYGDNLPNNVLNNFSNFLTKTIDGGEDEPDIFPDVIPYDEIESGDAFLICSDGLIIDKTLELNEVFKQYIVGTSSLEEAAKNLISFAFYNGSKDNITIILCSYGDLPRKKLKLKRFKYPPRLDQRNFLINLLNQKFLRNF